MILPQKKFTVYSLGFRVNCKRAFTLIEILLSVAVIGILIGVAIPSLNSFNQSRLLDNAQKEVISRLGLAQSKAHAGEVDRRLCDVSQTSLKGWYAEFGESSSSYLIYGRCISDQKIGASHQFNKETFYLPPNHIFTNLPELPEGSGASFSVMFEPVSGEVWFFNSNVLGALNCSTDPDPNQCYPPDRLDKASITIENTKTGEIKVIEVYANGQIKEGSKEKKPKKDKDEKKPKKDKD